MSANKSRFISILSLLRLVLSSCRDLWVFTTTSNRKIEQTGNNAVAAALCFLFSIGSPPIRIRLNYNK